MKLLKETLEKIESSNIEIMNESKKRWDSLVKPLGSLGLLEEIGIKISGITGSLNNKIDRKAIVVMAADNGVVEEGVSACPPNFTLLLAKTMAEGITGVATLGRFTSTDIYTVDIGLGGDLLDDRIINRKIAYGTDNFLKGPAMSYKDAIKSVEIGIEIGDNLYEQGYDILGTGELGIGNTTTSAAVFSVLSGMDVELTCGRGAGLTNEQYELKKNTIKRGIRLNRPDKDDVIDIISKVGGFDIGGLCGLYLSAAKNRKPIVIDGFISSTAAYCAYRLKEETKDYMIPSHLSDEPGAKLIMDSLGLKPMLNMNMRLGEGSACPLAFQIIESSLYTFENMGTYEDGNMSSENLVDLRSEIDD